MQWLFLFVVLLALLGCVDNTDSKPAAEQAEASDFYKPKRDLSLDFSDEYWENPGTICYYGEGEHKKIVDCKTVWKED